MIINTITSKGGGLTPTIRVTAPSGSNVTAQKQGSSIVIAPTVIEGTPNSTYIFANLDIAIYEVTGTLGTKSQTLTINVDRVALWEEIIDYKLWLYDGSRIADRECENVTGGWSATGCKIGTAYSALAPTLVKNESNMSVSQRTNSRSGYVGMQNFIDLTNYNKICLKVSNVTNGYYSAIRGFESVPSDLNSYKFVSSNLSAFDRGSGTLEYTIPTEYRKSMFIAIVLSASGGNYPSYDIEAVWLEQ